MLTVQDIRETQRWNSLVRLANQDTPEGETARRVLAKKLGEEPVIVVDLDRYLDAKNAADRWWHWQCQVARDRETDLAEYDRTQRVVQGALRALAVGAAMLVVYLSLASFVGRWP